MAQSVALFLKSNGKEIQGESSISTLDREHAIECLSFEDSVRTAREKSTGMATGRRTFEPVRFTKRIDKSSPLLAQALCDNEEIEATFKFYRPSPLGDGTTEHFFSVELSGARVSHIHRRSPDTIDPASAELPPLEEVGLVFHDIIWTYESTGAAYKDNWREQA